MEYQKKKPKKTNLLDNKPTQQNFKKNWVEINDDSRGM